MRKIENKLRISNQFKTRVLKSLIFDFFGDIIIKIKGDIMGRGRSSGGSSRGSSSGSSRGMSRSSFNSSRTSSRHYGGNRTTVIIGGGHHGHYHGGHAGPGTYIFMAVIFIMFALMALGFGINMIAEANRYDSVLAKCVDNEKTHGWYYTTYQYTVDGNFYENRSMEGWEFPEDINAVVEIYYLKSDPNCITEERPGSIGGGIGLILFAAAFGGAGALLIRTAVKSKNKVQSSSEGTTVEEKVETHNKCPYCGGKYNKSSDSCPKCGASKID